MIRNVLCLLCSKLTNINLTLSINYFYNYILRFLSEDYIQFIYKCFGVSSPLFAYIYFDTSYDLITTHMINSAHITYLIITYLNFDFKFDIMAYTNWIPLSVIYPIFITVNRFDFLEPLCNLIFVGMSLYICILTFYCPPLSEVDLGSLKYSVSSKILAKSVFINVNMVCLKYIQTVISVIYVPNTYLSNTLRYSI